MEEIWKDIEGWEGYYQVSNMGNVKSLNYHMTGKERVLKQFDNGKGYLYVCLCQDGKRKNYLVHRLVAEEFLDNSDNLPEVNHRDENKQNNNVENLEWCTSKQNCNYGTRNQRRAEKQRNDPNRSKPVIGIDRITGLIIEFASIMEASRQLGINNGHICECCNGKRKYAGGYYWHYVENDSYNHYISQND